MQKIYLSKNSIFFILFLITILIVNLIYEYSSYKRFKNDYIFETKASILNIYPKDRFTILKLKGEGFEFFASFVREQEKCMC
ncbi:hypothetical protein [Aliarcobacter skirrowii]|uniref:hypothetical protein n=1 Tax=Aliarcobacter skirrowii TaxID=28200 RepID=UPI00100C2BD1|nr:hypothetical protein [Aliarcobacter skirrowii]